MEPNEYRRGYATFCGRDFFVTPDVLIPRIETEQIIDEVSRYRKSGKSYTIADVGTGSGCLGITLSLLFPEDVVFLSDISKKALNVATINVAKHQAKVKIFHSNLLTSLPKKLDIIIANLPYIPSRRLPKLPKSVRNFEPHLALDGGPKGTSLINRLIEQISRLPKKPFLVILEIDDTHSLDNFQIPQEYQPQILLDQFNRRRFLKLVAY